jgi:hypothetical protein
MASRPFCRKKKKIKKGRVHQRMIAFSYHMDNVRDNYPTINSDIWSSFTSVEPLPAPDAVEVDS